MGIITVLVIMIIIYASYLTWRNRKVSRHEKGKGFHRHKMGHKHGEGFSIDFYAYMSEIGHWNPTFKVSFSMVTLISCIVFNNLYVSITVIIAMAYVTIVKGRLPFYNYMPVIMFQIGFILISAIAIAINFSKEPIGQYNLYLGLCYAFTSQTKLREATFLILKIFAAISALQMMALSTPSSEIISVLRKMHVPKIIIELMYMIYRFIFILMDVYIKMKNSARSRLGYCDIKTSYFTFGSIESNLLVISLKKANEYYNAMEARCFNGDLIFLEEDKKVDKKQIVAATVFILFLIMLWGYTK